MIMSNNTKKTLALVKEMELKPRVRVPYVAGVHSHFHAPTMFHSTWETSNFFDMFLPEGVNYVEVSVLGRTEDELDANTSWFDHIGREGLKIQGVTHRVIFGDWDDDGVAIMVPADAVKGLQDLGLSLQINGPADKAKVRKYFRRIRAHHEWAISGAIVATKQVENGEVLTVAPDSQSDIRFDMLHVDLKGMDPINVALADGVHLIDVNLCHTIGLAYGIDKLTNVKVGDAFKGTALSGLGLGKGFFHVVENATYGIVLYGAKKQVTFSEFFLGSLGDVKGADVAYSDLQSTINFDYHQGEMLYNQSVLFMQEVMEAIHNEDKMRHVFLTHMAPISEILSNEEDGGRESWVLLEALRKGVPVSAQGPMNPGLFRRVVRHLFTHVLDATKGRVPLTGIVGRFNLMPDLNCFLEDGSVDYRLSSIPAEAVVCMDLDQGPLAMYRQPSGHKKELVSTNNVHDRRFKKFRGQNRIILGADALEYLAIMGGGDMDDAVNATVNLSWVETMATGSYPLTALPAAQSTKALDADNKYRRGPAYPRQWSMIDFFEAVAASKEKASMSIGVVVNAIMLDELLSGVHKENMLTDIADRIVDAKDESEKHDLRVAYDWLRNREDRILRVVASNLEAFIDQSKTGAGDAAVLASFTALINEVRNNSMVIPSSFMIKNNKGRERVPAKRLMDMDFITAPSLVCETLNRIKFEADQMQEALVEEQWLNVDSIPDSLDAAFPRSKAHREEAFELRMAWGEAFQSQPNADLAIRYKNAIDNVVKPAFLNKELFEEDKVQIAVEHARLTYRGRKTQAERGENGRFRNYPDGLLWTNTIGLYYIKALEEAGLTGLYVPVQFDRWSRNLSRGAFDVRVVAGIVLRAEDDMMLGTTFNVLDEVEDGIYPMIDGMITVQAPAAELRAPRNIVNESFDNPMELDFDLDEVFARG
jgi:hypothetical protein